MSSNENHQSLDYQAALSVSMLIQTELDKHEKTRESLGLGKEEYKSDTCTGLEWCKAKLQEEIDHYHHQNHLTDPPERSKIRS